MGERKYGIHIVDHGVNPDTDIVFVHGLGGDAYDTWTHSKSKKCWPQHFLPNNVKDARILTFGYDTKIFGFFGLRRLSQLNFREQAEKLYKSLGQHREGDARQKKIIFVAHSLGGLLTMQALELSATSQLQHESQLIRFTVGLLFLGVPQQGSGLKSLLESCSKVGFLGIETVDASVREILDERSNKRAGFRQFIEKQIEDRGEGIKVICVAEEYKTNGAYVISSP